ncbi:hypothetical protein C0J52_11510, partial [Blattella germanica]
FVAIIDFRVSIFLVKSRSNKLNIPQRRTVRRPVVLSKVRRTQIPKAGRLQHEQLSLLKLSIIGKIVNFYFAVSFTGQCKHCAYPVNVAWYIISMNN